MLSNHQPFFEVSDDNTASDYTAWLESNQSLRMDANNPLFRETRRKFHLSRYEFARDFAKNKRVLDAACGTGYGSALLAELATRVDGVDISHTTVEWARKVYGNEHTAFHAACVEFTPFEHNTFDLVTSFETLEHTLSPATALWEFVRVMKPDGTGIFSVPNGWGLTPNHFVDFDQPLFERVLAEGFDHVELFYNNSGGRMSRTEGIGPLDTLDDGKAECLIAKCSGPNKSGLPKDLRDFWTQEIYESVFKRHREYMALRKSIPKLLRRLFIKN
jgi:ubiquinone/menaquinone biosynthesis C-methylase UbiE